MICSLDLLFCECDVAGFFLVFSLFLFYNFAEVTGPKAWRKDSDRGAKWPLPLRLARGGIPRRDEVLEKD